MKVYPINSFSYFNARKSPSKALGCDIKDCQNKHPQTYNLAFGSGLNYKNYCKALDTLFKMGINGEKIFLNKQVLKNLPNEPKKFDSCFEKLGATYDILKDYIESDCKLFDNFMRSKNPNFDKFLDVTKRMKEMRVFSCYIEHLFEFVQEEGELNDGNWDKGFDKLSKLLSLRKAVTENKSSLRQFDREVSDVDIDVLLFNQPLGTSNALEILGEKGVIYSLNDKSDKVSLYIAKLGFTPWINSIRERLIELTNPSESAKYKLLTEVIKDLKSRYDANMEPSQLKLLQNGINTAIYKRNEMSKNAIRDPKDVLERALMICELQSYSTHAEDLLNYLSPQTEDEKNALQDKILSKLSIIYGLTSLPWHTETLEKFQLKDSKYLASFFKAKSDYKSLFKNFMKIFIKNKDKTPLEVYETLEANKRTREILESHGINYDNYVRYNPNIVVKEIKNNFDEDTNISVKKVDMNNVLKSLTLGNEVGCCTKIGGSKEKVSIIYAKNKMFSAIEVLDGKNSAGNTMGFFALVNGKLSYIIDNIELKSEYAYQNPIRDAIIKCARKILEDAGCKDTQIYLSALRNKVLTNDLPLNYYDVKILGDTGEDKAYFDFQSLTANIHDKFPTFSNRTLYSVSYIADNTIKPEGISNNGLILTEDENNLNLYLHTDVPNNYQ